MSERRRLWCSLHHSFHRECLECVEADYADLEAEVARLQTALKAHDYHVPADCSTRKYQVPEGTQCDRCEPALAAEEVKERR